MRDDLKPTTLIYLIGWSVIAMVVSAFITSVIITFPEKEPVHEHVRTKHYVTKYRLEKVTFCKTEDKILLHDGTHSDIVLPVILFPVMEEVE